MTLRLHPYQDRAIADVNAAWQTNRSTLLVLPTGCGKTIVMARLASERAKVGRVLVLAHMRELITQAAEKFSRWAPELRLAIEMGEDRAFLDGLYPPDVVIASRQSISRKQRLQRFPADTFASVFIDEAHRATAGEYRRILERFGNAKVLGVSATPDRGDGEALGQVFESVAHTYELRAAIDDGWLVPILQKSVRVAGLDLSKIKTVAGDLNQGELEAQLRRDEHLHAVAEPIAELTEGRRTLAFTVTVAHAYDLARVLRGYGITADALDGTSTLEKRAEILGQFRSGAIQVLCNCALFTEGFDLPEISAVAIARPTKSRALFAQMVGRGTRLAEGKRDLLVLDFRGNAGKHLLVTPADILGGKITADEKARVDALLTEDPDMLVTAAIDQAKRESEARRKMAEEADRQKRARDAERRLSVGTHKSVRDVDPFGAAMLGLSARQLQHGDKPMTVTERSRLVGHGYPEAAIAAIGSSAEAREIIAKLDVRRRAGMASYKQAKTLHKYGFEGVEVMTKKQAGELITEIAGNGWRLPERFKKRKAL